MRIPVIAAALTLVLGAGCGAKPKSLEHEWKLKTRKDCAALAELLVELHGDVTRVQRAFAAEVKKTGPKRYLYNPGMFNRLGKMAEKLDLSKPRRAERLRRAAWMTHYRFVKGAGPLLAELHRLLALLRQLKASLDLGRSQEQKFGPQLAARKPGWIPLTQRKKPMFGVVLRDPKGATFTGVLGDPVRRGPGGTCQKTAVRSAEGYKLSDGKCYWFTRAGATDNRKQVNGSLRIFRNQDASLANALGCISVADVLMAGFRFRLLDLELILTELKGLDTAALARQLRQATGR